MVCSFSDVTERRRTERQLNYQATHDALTGLANRPVFIESLRQTLDHARRGGSRVGVLFIDLDRFKVVNDTQGHLVGDEVLSAIARRLQQTTRSIDTVARLSGDEFVVLCPDLADIESARRRRHRDRRRHRRSRSRCRPAATSSSPRASACPAWRAGSRIPKRCCATPTSRCTPPRSAAGPGSSCSTTRCGNGPSAAPRSSATCASRSTTTSSRSTTSRSSGYGDDGIIGLEALARWPHPNGTDHAGRVHPDRRGVGAHPAARHLGAEPGLRRGGALEDDGPGGRGPAHQREPLRPPARRPGRRRQHRRGAQPVRARARRAVARDHREHADGRRGRRGADARTRSASSACTSSSTTSAPATRRSPT